MVQVLSIYLALYRVDAALGVHPGWVCQAAIDLTIEPLPENWKIPVKIALHFLL